MKSRIKTTPKLLTTEEVAAYCSVSKSHIYRMTDRGAMPAPVKLGASNRYLKEEIDNWIANGCPDQSKVKKGNM